MTANTRNNGTSFALQTDASNDHDDELQLQPFVERIAANLANVPSGEPFVMSIEAPWGRGKTWCIAELKTQLESQFGELHRVEDFSPWLLNDHHQIVQTLLRKIQRWIDANDTATIKEIASDLGKFANAVGRTSNFSQHFGLDFSFGSVFIALAKIFTANDKAADSEALKAKVVNELKKAETRLFVFVDDLDRVTPDEFIATIRAIKAVADFPHVTYVLAFDAEIADQQLKAAGVARGNEYLDKVIQLRAPLPPITPQQKLTMFAAAISALPDYTRQRFEIHKTKIRFTEIFHGGLGDLLRSPRDVKRVMNRVSLFPKETFLDVNLADLIALCAIDITDNAMFLELCKHPFVFVKDDIPNETEAQLLERTLSAEKETRHKIQAYRSDLVAKSGKPATRKLLCTLFPNLASDYYTPNSPESLLRGYVSHERNLYAAMHYSLDNAYVSIETCRQLIASDSDSFESALALLLKTNSLAKTLRSLNAVLPYEPPEHRSSVWRTLTSTIREDAIKRENDGTRYVKTLARELVELIYQTERLARHDENGSLQPFSFRDWLLENFNSLEYQILWADSVAVATDKHDRPSSAAAIGSWTAETEAEWNKDLLTRLFEKHATQFSTGAFLNEPEAGYLLHMFATHLPEKTSEIVGRLCENAKTLDRLSERIVFAYALSSDPPRYQINFGSEHPLRKTNPMLVEEAGKRLQAKELPRSTRLALQAIVEGNAVQIDVSDFSSNDENEP